MCIFLPYSEQHQILPSTETSMTGRYFVIFLLYSIAQIKQTARNILFFSRQNVTWNFYFQIFESGEEWKILELITDESIRKHFKSSQCFWNTQHFFKIYLDKFEIFLNST